MIIDFALQKYPFIIATVVSIIVFFILKRFTDSLVARIGTKAEFPKARTQLVKKYIDVLLGALLFLVLVSIWGVKPDQIFPIEAEIKDISSFYTLLKTDSGENISVPNNLLLQKAIEIIK